MQAGDIDLYDGDDISRATGNKDDGDFGSKLSHIYQLSGFADPVYAEAYVTVHDYDIVLEILVINRTNNTLTNLTVELATMGDLKLIERPQSHTIGPNDQRYARHIYIYRYTRHGSSVLLCVHVHVKNMYMSNRMSNNIRVSPLAFYYVSICIWIPFYIFFL